MSKIFTLQPGQQLIESEDKPVTGGITLTTEKIDMGNDGVVNASMYFDASGGPLGNPNVVATCGGKFEAAVACKYQSKIWLQCGVGAFDCVTV